MQTSTNCGVYIRKYLVQQNGVVKPQDILAGFSSWLLEMVSMTPHQLIFTLAGGLFFVERSVFRTRLCVCLSHSFMRVKIPWIRLPLRIFLRIADTGLPWVEVHSLFYDTMNVQLRWIQLQGD